MKEMLQYKSRKASVEEIETEEIAGIIYRNRRRKEVDIRLIPEVPFGFINAQWEQFKLKIQEHDELWFADHQFSPLSGWGGWLLVRKNEYGREFVAASICKRRS